MQDFVFIYRSKFQEELLRRWESIPSVVEGWVDLVQKVDMQEGKGVVIQLVTCTLLGEATP